MIMEHDGTSSDRKIKCQFCHKIHMYQDEDGQGFLVDENISLLLNMKYCDKHEAAKKSYAVVSTGETAFYANVLLTKGIIGDSGK